MEYPTADEIHAMHERIVAYSDQTEAGVRNPKAVESALIYISEGYYGERPKSIHEKAAHLMRLITADILMSMATSGPPWRLRHISTTLMNYASTSMTKFAATFVRLPEARQISKLR